MKVAAILTVLGFLAMVSRAEEWDKLIGDFELFTITPAVDMGEVAASYDAVIVNFHDG